MYSMMNNLKNYSNIYLRYYFNFLPLFIMVIKFLFFIILNTFNFHIF